MEPYPPLMRRDGGGFRPEEQLPPRARRFPLGDPVGAPLHQWDCVRKTQG